MRKLLLLLMLFPLSLSAQSFQNIKDTVASARIFSVSFGGQLPGGDLGKRFGPSITPGFTFLFKVGNNWLFGAEVDYLYGSDVKEDSGIYKLASASVNNFVGTDGLYDNITLSERGYTITAKLGKIIPAFKSNKNSGIELMAGAGFIQHKISIIDVNETVPYLEGDYKKGYDRLTNGIVLTQFIGYSHLDKKRYINFYGGFEVMEGLTQNRRTWNFDQEAQDTKKRLDLLLGIKVGWMLPFYSRNVDHFYTN